MAPFAMGGEAAAPAQSSTQIDLYAAAAPEFPTGLAWFNTAKPLSLAGLRGKIVLLDFWTYGCVNCLHNFPELARLQAEFAGALVVVGVHSAKFPTESQSENIRQVILRYGIEHPVVNDAGLQMWNAWNVPGWPTLVLIDPAGNLAHVHVGEGPYRAFAPIIRLLIDSFGSRGRLDPTPLDLALERAGLPATVLSFPGKVLADPRGGRLFIADTGHQRIVVAALESGDVLQVLGSGRAGLVDGGYHEAAFDSPQGMALSPDGRTLYVADTGNHALRRVDLVAGAVETLAGTGVRSSTFPPRGGPALDTPLASPWDLALTGESLYVAMAGTHQIWHLALDSMRIDPLVGSGVEGALDGPGDQATLAQPSGLALVGNRLYFADSESSTIRWAEVGGRGGRTGILAGVGGDLFQFGSSDGVGSAARFQHPLGVTHLDGTLYVADTYNSRIRRIDLRSAEVTTLAGGEQGWRDGDAPLFFEPGGIAAGGQSLYVADTNNHVVRQVDPATGNARTLVLKGIQRFAPRADDAGYAGDRVLLPAARVGAGTGTVVLDVRLPPGYKVNEQAPSSMAWQVEGPVAVLPDDASRTLLALDFPLHLEVLFQPGSGSLIVDLALIFCETEKESLCLLENVRLETPLEVAASGPVELRLVHSVRAPALGE